MSVPHARGDGPLGTDQRGRPAARSPRTWGWTGEGRAGLGHGQAFPTHVGMDRSPRRLGPGGWCVPHARGDGPKHRSSTRPPRERSPRTWGWTARWSQHRPAASAFPTHVGMDRGAHPGRDQGGAFPTHVGMDRYRSAERPRAAGVPHARGDGPEVASSLLSSQWRSPRTWGWTDRVRPQPHRLLAFPTHVGMDRVVLAGHPTQKRVPHARGDGPTHATRPPGLT